MVNSNEIRQFLRDDSNFLGCFPLNKLPLMPKSFPKTLIVNTHYANQPGEHWLALLLTKDKCFYFDSFGGGINEKEIKDFLKCKYSIVTYSNKCIQHISSIKCGQFCMLFVKNVKNSKSYNQFISQFDLNNLKLNDNIVMNKLRK